MRMMFTIWLFAVCATSHADDFTSAAAKAAEKKYEDAVAKARDQYLADLAKAAKSALDAGQLGEANRITEEITFINAQKKSDEGDPIVLARRQIEGTRWTWFGRQRLTLKRGGEAVTSLGQKGRWEMLEPQTIIIKFQDLFVLGLNEDMDEFKAYPYRETTSKLSGGRRLGSRGR